MAVTWLNFSPLFVNTGMCSWCNQLFLNLSFCENHSFLLLVFDMNEKKTILTAKERMNLTIVFGVFGQTSCFTPLAVFVHLTLLVIIFEFAYPFYLCCYMQHSFKRYKTLPFFCGLSISAKCAALTKKDKLLPRTDFRFWRDCAGWFHLCVLWLHALLFLCPSQVQLQAREIALLLLYKHFFFSGGVLTKFWSSEVKFSFIFIPFLLVVGSTSVV